MKCALYKSPGEYGHMIVSESSRYFDENYTRISEDVDIDFPPLSQATIVNSEIAVLDIKRAELVTEFTQKLNTIDRRKSDLLALTDDRVFA